MLFLPLVQRRDGIKCLLLSVQGLFILTQQYLVSLCSRIGVTCFLLCFSPQAKIIVFAVGCSFTSFLPEKCVCALYAFSLL